MFSSKFIKATHDYCTYEKNVSAPYLRKTFTLDDKPETASITLTSTGFYRLWVNGVEVTPSRLASGITNPDEIVFYDTIDVAAHLTSGKNCLALLLGNGFSNCLGGYIWDFEKALFRSAPKLALSFEAKYGDASVSFEADESFKCAPSPIYFDDLRSGEFYNATAEIDGWNLPDFDDSAWTNAIPTDPARGKALPNETDPVVVTKELKAAKISEGFFLGKKVPRGMRPDSLKFSESAFYQPEEREDGYIFEFSENTACVPKLRIRGKKGQKITIQAAEVVYESGELTNEGIQTFYPLGFCQRDIYICKGDGVEEYIPSFTYHGARYFLVIGAEKEQVSDELLTMLVMNSDLAERGSFACSDPIANALQRNARISDLANFVYFPTDCPHREKNGWTGDAAMSAEHMIQNLAVEKSWKQWLRMICASQRESGELPGIVPTSGWGFSWGNGPVWDQVLVELPYQTYIYRGDKTLFLECSDSIMRYLNYITKRRFANGVARFGLGDWCHAGRRGGSNHLCPDEVCDTVTCLNICRKAAFLFGECGMKAQKEFAETLAGEFLEAARKYLIDFDTMTVKGNCQTAQSMGIYYDVFTNGEKAAAYRVLLDLIHEAGDHFDCGIIGMRTIFRVLAAHGDGELAYKMITRTDFPSYGIQVAKLGLASVPESFLRSAVDEHWYSSLNHHFMCDYSGFFIAHIAGLQVNPYKDNPNFIRIAPTFVDTLDYATAHYDAAAGRVSVRWERKEDGTIELVTERAEGLRGELILPKGYAILHRSNMNDNDAHGHRVCDGLFNATFIISKI